MVARSPPPSARLPKATPSDCERPAVERVERLRASDPRPNPIVPLVNSPSFLRESSRFDRDFLGAEHIRKEQTSRLNEVQKLEQLLSAKVDTIPETEVSDAWQARWERARGEAYARELVKQSAAQAVEARENFLQLTGGARSNQSGDSFDILTLQYHNTPSGYQLQQQVCSSRASRLQKWPPHGSIRLHHGCFQGLIKQALVCRTRLRKTGL